MLGQQDLQMSLDPVLLQTGVDAEVMAGVVQHLGQRDLQGVAVPAFDLPDRGQRLTPDAAPTRPFRFTASERARSISVQGGLIQFSGL